MSPSNLLVLPSKGEINRCGARLVATHQLFHEKKFRAYIESRRDPEYLRALQVVDGFRAAHSRPLSTTSTGLRQFVRTSLGTTPVVSQRLKRLPRIVRKLANMGDSNLARLEDIGGTRAIVDSLDAQNTLCRHIERVWGGRIKRHRDYLEDPKPTGYRAIHYVVERDSRRVEIQVRTQSQQSWANAIEAADSRFGLTLKDGTGPQSMLDYFTAVGAMLYHHEARIPVPPELQSRFDETSDAVVAEGFYRRRKGT